MWRYVLLLFLGYLTATPVETETASPPRAPSWGSAYVATGAMLAPQKAPSPSGVAGIIGPSLPVGFGVGAIASTPTGLLGFPSPTGPMRMG